MSLVVEVYGEKERFVIFDENCIETARSKESNFNLHVIWFYSLDSQGWNTWTLDFSKNWTEFYWNEEIRSHDKEIWPFGMFAVHIWNEWDSTCSDFLKLQTN